MATGDATHLDVEQPIQADSSRLQQHLENFSRNAIEHGGDDVAVTIDELDDGFSVEDPGPGVPADNREAAFGVGYSTRGDGTGFGLSVVKRVAQGHGRSAVATTGVESGARFEITGVASQSEFSSVFERGTIQLKTRHQ